MSRLHGLPALSWRAVRYGMVGLVIGASLTVCGYLVDYYDLYQRLPDRPSIGLLKGLHVVTPLHYFTDLFAIVFCFIGAMVGWIQDRVVLRAEELEELVEQRTRELRRSESRYALAAAGANEGLWEWDVSTDVVYYSPRWMAGIGLEEKEREGPIAFWLDRVHPDDRQKLEAALEAHVEGVEPRLSAEYRLHHRDNIYRWKRVGGLAERDADGQVMRVAGSQHDIHEAHRMEEQLRYLAVYDELTDLPNKTLFLDRLRHAMRRARVRRRRLAVLYLGIDRLRKVDVPSVRRSQAGRYAKSDSECGPQSSSIMSGPAGPRSPRRVPGTPWRACRVTSLPCCCTRPARPRMPCASPASCSTSSSDPSRWGTRSCA